MKNIWRCVKEFAIEEDAVGVVEIILILVVLISLVIIFKEQLTALVKKSLQKSQNKAIRSENKKKR